MAEQNTQPDSEIHFAVGCSPICDVVRKPKRRKRKSRPWHRVLGMLSALPLIWVLITGFLLNHEEDFGLNDKEITTAWVLSAYGMVPSGEPMSQTVNGKVITHWDGQVFYANSLVDLSGSFIGSAADGDGLILVSDQSIVRLDENGELIEQLDELSLPSLPLLDVASAPGSVWVKNAEGWHSPDADWLEFTSQTAAIPAPIALSPLVDKELKAAVATAWSGGGVSLSRLVLDLHSGNFFGAFSKYFYDLVVFCTLWLIGTGLVLQYRTSRRSRSAR